MKSLFLTLFIFLYIFPGYASATDLNITQKQRAEALYHIVRCPVCAGQSIGDSDAEISADLRLIIDQKIKAGQTDKQIKRHLVQIYGQDILFEPPNNFQTLFLNYGIWGLMIVSGAMFIWRRRADTTKV